MKLAIIMFMSLFLMLSLLSLAETQKAMKIRDVLNDEKYHNEEALIQGRLSNEHVINSRSTYLWRISDGSATTYFEIRGFDLPEGIRANDLDGKKIKVTAILSNQIWLQKGGISMEDKENDNIVTHVEDLPWGEFPLNNEVTGLHGYKILEVIG